MTLVVLACTPLLVVANMVGSRITLRASKMVSSLSLRSGMLCIYMLTGKCGAMVLHLPCALLSRFPAKFFPYFIFFCRKAMSSNKPTWSPARVCPIYGW